MASLHPPRINDEFQWPNDNLVSQDAVGVGNNIAGGGIEAEERRLITIPIAQSIYWNPAYPSYTMIVILRRRPLIVRLHPAVDATMRLPAAMIHRLRTGGRRFLLRGAGNGTCIVSK